MGLFGKKEAPDERYQALEAEYRNYRARTQNQLARTDTDAVKRIITEFLPIYDDLDRALACPCQDEAFYHGIELIRQKLLEKLSEMKVVPMQSQGRCFNPDYHEAVEHITDPALGEEVVAQVILTGFTMDEEVIRHAKVVVAN